MYTGSSRQLPNQREPWQRRCQLLCLPLEILPQLKLPGTADVGFGGFGAHTRTIQARHVVRGLTR